MFDHALERDFPHAKTAERRHASRVSATYPLAICDRRDHLLARGRTVDISQAGVFAVVVPARGPIRAEHVVVELTVPRAGDKRAGRDRGRVVRYLAKVVRNEQLGQMCGLGLELLEKLPPP